MTSDLRSISSSEKVTSKRQKVDYARFLARLDDSSDGSSQDNKPKSSPHTGKDMKPVISTTNIVEDMNCECESKGDFYDSNGRKSCRQKTPVDSTESGKLDMEHSFSSSSNTESSTSPEPSPNRLFEEERMGMLQTNSDYESIRNAQILENKARLASLGLLRSKTQVKKNHKVDRKVDYSCYPRRSSHRLKGISVDPTPQIETKEQRLGLAPFIIFSNEKRWLSPEEFAQRCASESRGSIYHPIYGTSCHICGKKKLCGEVDCKRCGDLDLDQLCIGKTDCSVCHFSRGVLCRTCLKVRYGEELEEVTENKLWMCPHCVEDKGIKPYWICNRSECLKKRNIAPISSNAFKARKTGHESVAHLLMDELQRATAVHSNDEDKA